MDKFLGFWEKNIWYKITDRDYVEVADLLLYNGFRILLIILFTWILLKWRVALTRRIFRLTKLDSKKQATLTSILLSLSRYVIITIAVLMILPLLGVDMTPILASAGVLGVALGFGTQNLIKDVIAGFFIMFEDWMHVGDYVKIGDTAGTVEEIGLRSTIIREWSGKQVHLLNSSITQLVNYNRDKMRPIISFNIPYEYKSDKVAKVIDLACEKINNIYKEHLLTDHLGKIIEPFMLYGITDIENNALGAKYTVAGLVKDESYFLMGREVRKVILEQLLEQNIQVAYPKRIYSGDFITDSDNI